MQCLGLVTLMSFSIWLCVASYIAALTVHMCIAMVELCKLAMFFNHISLHYFNVITASMELVLLIFCLSACSKVCCWAQKT